MSSYAVCFYTDSPQTVYAEMTRNAISSFLSCNSDDVILLGKCREDIQYVVVKLSTTFQSRVTTRIVPTRLISPDWNETQMKLHIQDELIEHDCVFWLDSDTITFGDLSPFFKRFVDSRHRFYLVPDLVMDDPTWSGGFVPQACLMGFKKSAMNFFPLWIDHWKDWITPEPFARHPDPRPQFVGSSFCIEQYAFGTALEEYLGAGSSFEDCVLLFPRDNRVFDFEEGTSTTMTMTPYSSWSSSSAPVFDGTTELVRVDQFGDAVLHTYNVHYERVRQWWDSNYTLGLGGGVTAASGTTSGTSNNAPNIKGYLAAMSSYK